MLPRIRVTTWRKRERKVIRDGTPPLITAVVPFLCMLVLRFTDNFVFFHRGAFCGLFVDHGLLYISGK